MTKNIKIDEEKEFKEIKRYITVNTKLHLWTRTAGRCQFPGCNIPLYKSPVTQELGNFAQKAHIYSFSKSGPRGWEENDEYKVYINNVNNLLLVCPVCHIKIDDNEKKYTAKLLKRWKSEHENRIEFVTGIASNKKSHVVFYEANIGKQKPRIIKDDAYLAMFPDKYPASERPKLISMNWSDEDSNPIFWEEEKQNLKREYNRQIRDILEHDPTKHFSLFSFAPIPLLIYLGTIFNEKLDVDVFQPIREPKGWRWQEYPERFKFIIKEPDDKTKTPALVISLSAKVNYERIYDVMRKDVSIWELTVPDEFISNDNIRNNAQLSQMRTITRKLIRLIYEHSGKTPLSIFPAMAISTSIEMGRVRMPKADMPWIIYDQNNKSGKFIETITIGDEND